jgi:hypothetical protein
MCCRFTRSGSWYNVKIFIWFIQQQSCDSVRRYNGFNLFNIQNSISLDDKVAFSICVLFNRLMSEKKLQETSFYSAFNVQLRLLSVTQENIIDLGSQNASGSPKAIKLLLKFEVFSWENLVLLVFVWAIWLNFLICAKVSAILLSNCQYLLRIAVCILNGQSPRCYNQYKISADLRDSRCNKRNRLRSAFI